MEATTEQASKKADAGNSGGIAFGYFCALLIVLLFGYSCFRDSGVLVPVNDKLSNDLTEQYLNTLNDAGIGYVRSGSGSIVHGGSASVYSSYEGLQPQFALARFDYKAPAFTPHAHFIVHEDRIEVRHDADLSAPYSETLTKLSDVIEFAVSKYGSLLEDKRSWQ